jgi:predicted nucleic acid-binding protein
VRALLDTNVVVRHLTGSPRPAARRATAFLADADRLDLPDLVVAETVYVLRSVYAQSRSSIALAVRALLAFPAVVVESPDRLRRALEVYELDRLDFGEAYLVALAEESGTGTIVSFDRAIDRVGTVVRVEP